MKAGVGKAAGDDPRRAASWPPGSGEMAARVRAHDWAATPLGPVEGWPERLKAVVELALASPLVSTLVCGPERVLIYNDAAAALYGELHPAALGRPLPEVFPEGWAVGGPLYARVFAGEAVQVAAQPLDLRGELGREPDVFDATLTPVRDESGAVAAAHMVGFAVGARPAAEAALRASEARQAFLLELSDALRPLADPVAIQEMAARVLGERLGADRAYYVEIDEARQIATVGQEYRRGRAPSLMGEHAFAAYGATLERLRSGRAVVFGDVETEPEIRPADLPAYRRLGLRAFLNTPLIKNGELVAAMCVVSAEPRRWTAVDIALVLETGERTWAAVERARAEAALRESEARFRALATAGANMLYRMRPDWRRMHQLDGRGVLANAPEPIEDWAEEYLLPEDRPTIFAAIGEAIRAKSVFELEHRVRRADGGIGWVVSRAVPLLGPDGEIVGWFGAGRDVTERRDAAEKLRDAEERHRADLERQVRERTAELKGSRDLLQATMNSSMDMIQVFEAVRDGTGAIVDFRWALNNHAAERHLGDVLGRSLIETNPGVVPEGIFDTFKRVVETGEPHQAERRYVHEQFDGWFHQSVVKLGDGVATTTSDVTQRKTAEAELLRLREDVAQAKLRESEDRFRTLADVGPQLVWSGEGPGADFYNRRWYDYTGLDAETSRRPDAWHAVVHPDDLPKAIERSEHSARTGEPYDVEYRLRRRDGAYRWHIARAVRVPGTERWVGAATDIDDLKRADERLRASEERLQGALAIGTVGVAFWNEDFALTDVNDAFLRMTGFTREEILGKAWGELTPAEFHQASREAIAELAARGENTPYEKQFSARTARAGGACSPPASSTARPSNSCSTSPPAPRPRKRCARARSGSAPSAKTRPTRFGSSTPKPAGSNTSARPSRRRGARAATGSWPTSAAGPNSSIPTTANGRWRPCRASSRARA